MDTYAGTFSPMAVSSSYSGFSQKTDSACEELPEVSREGRAAEPSSTATGPQVMTTDLRAIAAQLQRLSDTAVAAASRLQATLANKVVSTDLSSASLQGWEAAGERWSRLLEQKAGLQHAL